MHAQAGSSASKTRAKGRGKRASSPNGGEASRGKRAKVSKGQGSADARETRSGGRRRVEVSEDGSRRVGDIRAAERAERAKRNRARYRRYLLRIGAVVGGVLLVVFGAIFLYRSDLFHVDNVQVNGVSHLTSNEITSLAQVPDDSTLLRVDTTAIVERLKQNAWVQDATVSRVFPDTLEVDITEREPGAVVRVSDKAIWVISKDGAWLSAATDEDWQAGPRIVDVSKTLAQPVSGSDCDDGGIKNALAIIAGMSDELASKVQSISAESSIKTSLNLEDGITVAFGDSSDIEVKEAAIEALLEKYSGKISYINVRVPSRPTYRTLDES